MKKLLTLTLLMSALATGAQDINNQPTAGHVNIPGTRALVLLPKGFTLSNSFVGVQKEGMAVIQVWEFPTGNFYINGDLNAKKNFEDKGAIIFDYKESHFDGYEARYLYGQNEPGQKFRLLSFGDSTFSISFIGFFSSTDDSTDQEVKRLMESICYDKNIKADPLATAPFSLDESKSTLRFSEAKTGYYYYTEKGVALKDKIEPIAICMVVPTQDEPKAVSESFLEGLEYLGNKISKKNERNFTLNGAKAYEVEAYTEKNGEKAMVYVLVVEGPEKKTLSFQGKARSEYEKKLKQFKKLGYTVEWKK